MLSLAPCLPGGVIHRAVHVGRSARVMPLARPKRAATVMPLTFASPCP